MKNASYFFRGVICRNEISIEELEKKIEAGEEVIDRFFDATTTRVGTRHIVTRRTEGESESARGEIPLFPLDESDAMAGE